MKTRSITQPADPDQIGSLGAIKRAALRARELARQTNTPCYIMRGGRIVDVSHESAINSELQGSCSSFPASQP
jgi:hypothetical protein